MRLLFLNLNLQYEYEVIGNSGYSQLEDLDLIAGNRLYLYKQSYNLRCNHYYTQPKPSSRSNLRKSRKVSSRPDNQIPSDNWQFSDSTGSQTRVNAEYTITSQRRSHFHPARISSSKDALLMLQWAAHYRTWEIENASCHHYRIL